MLDKAAPESVDYEVYRNAVVKGYELALETSGKLLRKSLKEFTGSSRVVDELSYKDLLRQALKHGLIAGSLIAITGIIRPMITGSASPMIR
ncbi:MAG: hypothetical protein WBM07_11165 [Chitinivibrionales bacterium]